MKEMINNSLVAKLKPSDKAYDVWDSKLTGFIIRVMPSGTLVYRCEYGRGKRITLGRANVLSPAQARDKAKEVLSQAVIGILPNKKKPKAKLTLEAFINNDYDAWRRANRKTGNEDLKRLSANFVKEFGDKFLEEVDSMLIEKWRTDRINKGIKASTVNRDINILKSTLSKAVEWKLISTNPLQELTPFKIDSKPQVRYLDKAEEMALKQALALRDAKLKLARTRTNKWRQKREYPALADRSQFEYADHITPMVLLSLNTGLRRGELFNLRWDNVNLDLAILTVRGTSTKSAESRYIPLNSTALAVLKAWHTSTQDTDLVFTNPKTNKAFTNVKRAWRTVKDAAKIKKFRWHDMRHHFASMLVMAGVDLNTVRELLGHVDIEMTLRYAHLAPGHKANAVAKLVEEQII